MEILVSLTLAQLLILVVVYAIVYMVKQWRNTLNKGTEYTYIERKHLPPRVRTRSVAKKSQRYLDDRQ